LFAQDVHRVLSVVVLATAVAAMVEGCVRTILGRPPGKAAARTRAAVLLMVGLTASSGLALVVTGSRPQEWLHALYAVLAFGLIPVADNAAVAFRSERGKGLVRLGGSIVTIVVLTRLFQTG
jgi:hypothetical protein